MSLHRESCPSCSAPIDIPSHGNRMRCPYCSTSLRVERSGDDVALQLATQVNEAIQKSGANTQAELQRLQLHQELSNAQMRLAHTQSEIRILERARPDNVTRRQLQDLRGQEAQLDQEITALQRELDPDADVPDAQSDAGHRALEWNLSSLAWLLFSFQGRATRTQFWLGAAVVAICLLIVGAASGGSAAEAGVENSTMGPVAGLLLLVTLWIGIAVSVKRFQDRDKPGWWVLIGLIPAIGPLWLLGELGFLPGTPYANRFG